VDGAKDDLVESVALLPGFTQSLVKLASVYMEQGDPKKAFQCFDDAIEHNPNDPDVFYHRGQGMDIHMHLSSQLLSALPQCYLS
jgi:import receptor subunit TOM70